MLVNSVGLHLVNVIKEFVTFYTLYYTVGSCCMIMFRCVLCVFVFYSRYYVFQSKFKFDLITSHMFHVSGMRFVVCLVMFVLVG